MIENELQGLLLLIVAALMGTFYAYIIKLSGNRFVLFSALNAVSIVIGLFLLPLVPVPDKESWPYLLTAGLSYNIMLFWLIKAYQTVDLSQLVPLRIGLQIFIVTVLVVVFHQEQAGLIGYLALALLLAGFVIQVPFSQITNPGQREGLIFTGLMGLFCGIQLYCDFQGVRLSGNPMSYIVYECFYGLPVTILGFFLHRKSILSLIWKEKRHIVFGSLLDNIGYALIIYTVYYLNVLYVLPVSNLSVVFTTLAGIYLLKEKFPARRIAASILIFLSVVLVHFRKII